MKLATPVAYAGGLVSCANATILRETPRPPQYQRLDQCCEPSTICVVGPADIASPEQTWHCESALDE
jgi:hypothetical protein